MIDRQQAKEIFVGPLPTICTPFDRDGAIDFAMLSGQVDHHLNAGAKTLIMTAGNSLYSLLSDQEIADVTKAVAQQVAGRAVVVAADRQWATRQEVKFAQYAKSVGVDILMVQSPDWAMSCTPQSMAAHHCAVGEHIPIMMVTNLFLNRPVSFVLEMTQIIVDQCPNLVSIKDDIIGECSRRLGMLWRDELALFSSGTKRDHLMAWPYGFRGYLSNYIMFNPEAGRRYWDTVQSGDTAGSLDFIARYDIPFWELISDMPGGTDAALRGALELFGIGTRWRRSPYHSLGDADMQKLKDFFNELGLL